MKAIVYTSNTGYTKQYAEMLAEKLQLPVYSLDKIKKSLSRDDEIIYFGWLMAGFISGYKAVSGKCKIRAVCAVGMGANGSQTEEARKSNKICKCIPLFVLQGGLDMARLNPIYRFMMKIVTKKIEKDMLAKPDRTEDEENILTMTQRGGNYVNEKNLACVIEWYNNRK